MLLAIPHVVIVELQGKVFPIVTGEGQIMAVYRSRGAAKALADSHPLCQAGDVRLVAVPGAKVNA
jgi:hypothetical protein